MRHHLCFFLLLSGLAKTLPAIEHPSMIRGKVVERRTNEPIAGIVVELAGHTSSTLTDSLGMFVLSSVDSGRHTVFVHVPEWGSFQRTVDVRGQSVDMPTIRVWPSLEETSYEGVIAHYSLDGNAIDDGPNGWDGANHGASPSEDRHGLTGGAMHFDGRTQRIEVDHQDRLNQLPLSIAFWINVESGVADPSAWLGKYLDTDGESWCVFYEYQSLKAKQLNEHFSSGATWHTGFKPDSTWHHVVVTMDTSGTVLFVDKARMLYGVRNFRYTERPGFPKNQEPLCIGYLNSEVETPGLLGSIDDLFVFDHVLSVAEIEKLMKK